MQYFRLTIENYHSPEKFYVNYDYRNDKIVTDIILSQMNFDLPLAPSLQNWIDKLKDGEDLHEITGGFLQESTENWILQKYRRNGHLWYTIDSSGERIWE